MFSPRQVLLLGLLTFVLGSVKGHLVLTFPPARKYALDFLDNIRTRGPCGMQKGMGPVTSLQSGSNVNLTWHIAYPHAGGFYVQLLDWNGTEVQRYPSGTGYVSTDPTALGYTLMLPAAQCENCTLRVMRQAAEWGANYTFWSCADVDIVTAVPAPEMCSGHGNYTNNMCQCERTYSGLRCQYKDDCVDNTDCGRGTCVDTMATYYPKRQCFCPVGHFGKHCDKHFTSMTIDITRYRKTELHPEFHLYHRLLPELNEIEFMIRAKSNSWVAVGFRRRDTPDNCQNFPAAGSAPISEPEGEPEGEPAAEPETPAVRAEPGGATSEPEPEPEAEAEALGRHAMDCVDVVVGRARGNLSKVVDSYTRDRSTPLEDAAYGGSESLTAALGYETADNYTVILFRRKLAASEATDHPILDELTHVIWARGQRQGNYVHVPQSGLESGSPTIPDYYRPDELKYHGHAAQRGVASINFLETSSDRDGDCQGRWPLTCPAEGCGHSVMWSLDEASDSVDFTMTATLDNSRWLGIGFSADRQMPMSDAIIGWVNNDGTVQVTDSYLTGYSQPERDTQNDVTMTSGRFENGVITISFRRRRNTGDGARDFIFTNSDCAYFFFAHGGAYDAAAGTIRKHASTPAISPDKICVRTCSAAVGGSGLLLQDVEIILIACAAGFLLILLIVVGICKCRESCSRGKQDTRRLTRDASSSEASAGSGLPSQAEIKGEHSFGEKQYRPRIVTYEEYMAIMAKEGSSRPPRAFDNKAYVM